MRDRITTLVQALQVFRLCLLSAETRTLIWLRIYFALPYSWTCGSAYRQDWRASVARWVWGYYRAAFRSAWLSPRVGVRQ